MALIDLGNKRVKLLRDREVDWHMKSRAVWLELGDENA